jgi:hypothetical protein
MKRAVSPVHKPNGELCMTALMLDLTGGAAKRGEDILAKIAKTDLRYCSGVNRMRDKRLTLRSWTDGKFVFATGNFRFTLDLETTKSILDGACLPIGDDWIEQRPMPRQSSRR